MGNEAIYLSCAETAKLIRQALKKAFPAVKFSVRSSVYSGGASINVEWTDGPITQAVEAVVGQYSGANFDGMEDLKTYNRSWLMPDGTATLAQRPSSASISAEEYQKPHEDAVLVRFGADFIFATRRISKDFEERCKALYLELDQAGRFEVEGKMRPPFNQMNAMEDVGLRYAAILSREEVTA